MTFRIPACTCSDYQLYQVGCDCEAGDPVAHVSCWPEGVARGRAATFKCRSSYAELEAQRRYGPNAKVFSVYVEPEHPAPLTREYINMMSRDS